MPEVKGPLDLPPGEGGKFITVEPNYEVTAEFFARLLFEHGFDRGSAVPVISFIEQIRYLSIKDPQAVERIINKLKGFGPVTVITAEGTGQAMLHEDDHLEMLHEDRYTDDFE